MGILTESESERGASSLQLDTWWLKAPLWCGGLRLAEAWVQKLISRNYGGNN